MTRPACLMCVGNEIWEHAERHECARCVHESKRAAEPEAPAGSRVVKAAHGHVLADGDCLVLIEDWKLSGSEGLNGGSKTEPICHVGATTRTFKLWIAYLRS